MRAHEDAVAEAGAGRGVHLHVWSCGIVDAREVGEVGVDGAAHLDVLVPRGLEIVSACSRSEE